MRSLPVNLLWFVCSITLNALGNSFMIIANLGSAPGQLLGKIWRLYYRFPLVSALFFEFLFVYPQLFNENKIYRGDDYQSIALTFVFGILIDLFVYLHHIMYVPENIWIRCLYLLIGLNLMAVAICIYFQSSSVYLPSDYLLKAFGKLMNNYTLGTILCTSIPLSISILIMLFQHYVTGLGIGTMLYMFGIGLLIDHYNRWIVIHKVPKQNTYLA